MMAWSTIHAQPPPLHAPAITNAPAPSSAHLVLTKTNKLRPRANHAHLASTKTNPTKLTAKLAAKASTMGRLRELPRRHVKNALQVDTLMKSQQHTMVTAFQQQTKPIAENVTQANTQLNLQVLLPFTFLSSSTRIQTATRSRKQSTQQSLLKYLQRCALPTIKLPAQHS